MAQPKTRKERIAEYGSFLLCPAKGVWCSEMDSDDGICRRSPCYREDAAYLAEQELREQRMQENARREQAEREKERLSPPAPVRRQAKTRAQLLEEEIERKESHAERLYRLNRPRAADKAMNEAMALRRQLRKVKGA